MTDTILGCPTKKASTTPMEAPAPSVPTGPAGTAGRWRESTSWAEVAEDDRREAQTAQITDESGRLRLFSVRSTAAAAAWMASGVPRRSARIFPLRSGIDVLVEASRIHGSRMWPVADRHGSVICTLEVVPGHGVPRPKMSAVRVSTRRGMKKEKS